MVVTGGVLSGLGKGIAAASIGHLLTSVYKVISVKCDGYLNTDPGTMNPVEHGEVFVLDDGGEVDMDFGHYERFLNVTCNSNWNLTMGKVYKGVMDKERKGDYLGGTVQLIPHVTNYITDWWKRISDEHNADVTIIEIGGTVGDIENELYIEAARQLQEVGKENILYVHCTYVPIPAGVKEQKSKPTQQSVQMLRERGIIPDIVIGRCSEYLTDAIKKKIANFCGVEKQAVITGLDVDTIYKVPLIFEQEGIIPILEKKLGIAIPNNSLRWKSLVESLENPQGVVKVAICGKYTALEDSYASIFEALRHCQAHCKVMIDISMVETSRTADYAIALKDIDAVIVPGGFGSRGIEGKIKAIQYCRENNIPFLGICYGMQLAVVEFARNVCQILEANSAEVEGTTQAVIDILEEQKEITNKGGTMRLGSYPAQLVPGSKISQLYGKELVAERHRHRYEVNSQYHNILQENGLIFSGMSPDRKLVEFIELPTHPYFVGTQAHPELKSKLEAPAPLFLGLIKAAMGDNI